jgi:hypothetical protein
MNSTDVPDEEEVGRHRAHLRYLISQIISTTERVALMKARTSQRFETEVLNVLRSVVIGCCAIVILDEMDDIEDC